MNTHLFLLAMGLLGIAIHTVQKLDSLNKQTDGNVNMWKFIRVEWTSILLSVLVVGGCVVVASEIKELALAGKWLALAYIGIGYMAQSLLVKFGKRAEKLIDDKLGNDRSEP